MKRTFICIAVLLFLVLTVAAKDKVHLGEITHEMRESYFKRAIVWERTDIARKDILRGPQNEIALLADNEIKCRYVEPKEKLEGVQPKFLCRTETGDILRVKYGKETMEIYAEVAASRLLWALGFFSDEVYPARVNCLDCPEDPFRAKKDDPRGARLFADAIIEREFDGVIIEEKDDQGWTWKELEEVKEEEGGSPRSHIDALKLLAVFLQHADSKADNQRLACLNRDIEDPDGDGIGYCARPILMIQDAGSTFGSGAGPLHINKMDFNGWKSMKIWNTPKEAEIAVEQSRPLCIGNITGSRLAGEEGLNDPIISEEGRIFLADLLNQLTQKQIRDLFKIAGVDRLDQYVDQDGSRHKVSADDWVAEFNEKREQLNDNLCSGKDPQNALK